MKLKTFALLGAITSSSVLAFSAHAAQDKTMTVFKSPWCGCCEVWVEELKKVGFKITVNDMEDLSLIKKQASVTEKLEGCHTAVMGEYVLEGHVPLAAIEKLLAERPPVRGLAVPGMPEGSLGMEFDEDARYTVFSFEYDISKPATVFYESGV